MFLSINYKTINLGVNPTKSRIALVKPLIHIFFVCFANFVLVCFVFKYS